jgi:PEP-CTERM motif
MKADFALSPLSFFGSARSISPTALGSTSSSCCFAAIFALALSAAANTAFGVINPVPLPLEVPGKVISDWILTGDQQSNGIQNPQMTRSWKGDGTTKDSLDYTNSLAGILGPIAPPAQAYPDVDALANAGDLFFHQLVNDYATLLVSPRVLQNNPPGTNEIYYQTATPFGSLAGVWAKNAPDIGGAPPPTDNAIPEGIDGLEVWGSDSDHNMFSLYTDPPDVTGRRVSVFQYDMGTDTSSAYIYNDEIRTAIGLAPNDPDVDVDGTMTFDVLGDGIFNAGDSLLFTVAENTQFHGGEIWVWDFGSQATFLKHGGVTWDTANLPGLIFNWVDPATGGITNDIDALEAILIVPEPGSFALLLVGLIATCGRRRKR